MNNEFEKNNEENLKDDDFQGQETNGENGGNGKNGGKNLVVVSEILPEKLTILPITPRPIFPNLFAPLTFSGQQFIEAIKEAVEKNEGYLGLVLLKGNQNEEETSEQELYRTGTAIRILKTIPVEENTIQIVVKTIQRFAYVRTLQSKPTLRWEVKYNYDNEVEIREQLKPYMLAIMASVKELLKINPILQEQLKLLLSQMSYDKPHIIIDLVSSILSAEPEKLQELHETFDLIARSEKLLILLKEEVELFKVQEKIQQQINEKVGNQQKEYFLREQLKAIKKELGLEKDDKSAEIEKFEERIKRLTLTEEAAKVIRTEIDKMRMIEPSSPEYQVSRNYVDELTSIPWGIFSKDKVDIKRARKILDRDHYGLNDVKNRILQFVSTIVKTGNVSGSIICLVGPPGVGKTSIGKSIADALGRDFYRFSVGGMRDEAEIKGHRRTYIGAMPGKIMQALKRTETANPVLMLDEIDKIGASYQGDPASALLEVLDPEQNSGFLDHYLDVRFDLSKVLFITTANQLDTIPQPLLDRMEIISLSGYILEEKVQIAKRYLIPRQMQQHGLTPKEISITDSALRIMVDRYAREAGVRNLENQIKKVMRQVTLAQAETSKKSFRVTEQNIEKYLGKPIFITEELYEKEIPGVTLGLAWTAMGGATLYIEASAIPGGGGFQQTGQLGNVMQESTQIAYTYAQSLLASDAQLANFFGSNHIHLHVPAGATPKDGPSAGITMTLALYSLATGKPVRKGIAMTGEITLTGKVLPIGGVREKTIAARRVGVFELIFPKDNRKDFESLPDYIRDGISAHFVDYFDDVLKVVYGK